MQHTPNTNGRTYASINAFHSTESTMASAKVAFGADRGLRFARRSEKKKARTTDKYGTKDALSCEIINR